MSSTPDPTEEIKLTNSTSSSIVLMLPTTSTQTTDDNGTIVYGQALEILTAVDGTKTIPGGSTKTFVLDQTYVDPTTGKSAYSTIYDLLPCTADWYVPVANIGVIQSFTKPPSYPAQTVTAASVKAFNDAIAFVQAISAYPSSALATQYQQALNQAQTNAAGQANGSANSSSTAAQSLTNTTSQFFKGTKQYQDVTVEAVVAIQSYYATFPFVWAGFATGTTTYYLYSSNGSATSFVGTISITAPKSPDVTKPNAASTCTFTPASNGSDTTTVNVDTSAAESLTYTGGQFLDNVSVDNPQIAVNGTFQIKSRFTNNPDDTEIIPVLTGTIKNSTCIGFNQPQLSSNPNATFWDTLFNPQGSAQIFQSVMEIGGAVMMLAFLGGIVVAIGRWVRGNLAAKQPTQKELFDEQLAKFKESMQEVLEGKVQKMSGGKLSAPANDQAAENLIKDQEDLIENTQAEIQLQKGDDALAENLETVAEDAPDFSATELGTLEDLGGQLQDIVQAFQNADQADLATVVSKQTANLGDLNAKFTAFKAQVNSTVTQTQDASIQANQNAVNQAQKEAEDAEEDATEATTEGNPEATDPIEAPEVAV